jgi:hypothetical protein
MIRYGTPAETQAALMVWGDEVAIALHRSTGRQILPGASRYTYTSEMTVQQGTLQIGHTIPDVAIQISSDLNIAGGSLIVDYNTSGTGSASTVQNILGTTYNNSIDTFQTGKINNNTSSGCVVTLGYTNLAGILQMATTLTASNNTDLSKLIVVDGAIGSIDLASDSSPNLETQAISLLTGGGVAVPGATPIPEPSSLTMLASLLALGGACGIVRKRSRR